VIHPHELNRKWEFAETVWVDMEKPQTGGHTHHARQKLEQRGLRSETSYENDTDLLKIDAFEATNMDSVQIMLFCMACLL
jgi:hypothetical protein